MFARRTLAVATRTALSATKQVAAARSFHVAAQGESVARRYLALGGATLLTGFGMYTYQSHSVSAAEKALPLHGAPGTNEERTFIAIKPDGVQRGLISEVIARFERKGYKLVAIKVVYPTKEFAAKHYDDLKDKPFFGGLVQYFSSGPVIAMVWEGKGVIKGGRRLVGATNPDAAEDGSLRGDFCIEVGRNIVHGSDAPDSAEHEINLWFKEGEIVNYPRTIEPWVYGKN